MRDLLFLALVLFAALGFEADQTEAGKVLFQLPPTKRTEGRITLEWTSKDQSIKHELAFREVVDSDTRRSTTSIGYITHEPSVYYARGETVLMRNKENGLCEKLESPGAGGLFVPELDWFLKYTYTYEELREGLSYWQTHHVGPSGILLMLIKREFKYNRDEKHRNVKCQVSTAKYNRTMAHDITAEVLTPDLSMFDKRTMNFFTVREIARQIPDGRGGTFDTTLTIDYFFTETIDKEDKHQLNMLEEDLNLPMSVGCSDFLKGHTLEAYGDSFIMTFEDEQNLPGQLTSIAYDHQFNYLRKEIVGESLAVWDLNEDLLYHVDLNLAKRGPVMSAVDIEVPFEECSVLSVERSAGQGPSDSGQLELTRPYAKKCASLDLITFLGAKNIVYMGQSRVRDMPCSIFETVLKQAPRVFQTDIRLAMQPQEKSEQNATASKDSTPQFDYVLEYFVFKTSSKPIGRSSATNKQDITEQMLNDNFWPARINLFVRDRASGLSHLVNSLEVHDFHWGLFGWLRKPSALFMMPPCFDNEDEQLNIQLALEFDQLNRNQNQKLLVRSKYKLEWELMNDIFKALELSRLHMTEYELTLGRHQVLANFVISDRLEDKRVSFFGEGELPNADAYLNNRIELSSGRESLVENCIMSAAHIKDISMVIYCQIGFTCTAIFGETQPVIKRGSSKIPCQAYRFEAGEPPKSGLKSVQDFSRLLKDRKFVFETLGTSTTPGTKLLGKIQDFEVERKQQLIIINNYRYALPEESTNGVAAADESTAATTGAATKTATGNVRHYASIPYQSAGDCARMCNLDAGCRSYSYCQQTSGNSDSTKQATKAPNARAEPVKRCVLSSLDLRTNQVDLQLVNAHQDTNNQLIVVDKDLAAKKDPFGVYKLDLMSSCDIYERDILSLFTQADESLQVDGNLAEQVTSAPSASECARRVINLESKYSGHYEGSSFAYCPQTRACITDEKLFGEQAALGDTSKAIVAVNGTIRRDDDETLDGGGQDVTCQLYRKRYQTYFNISPKVVARIDHDGQATKSSIKHIDLPLGTVEECARACWQSFGHVCLSFDYCTPGLCMINSVADEYQGGSFDESNIEYETRAGCLGYRRDMRLDHLRREHLIGGFKLLGVKVDGMTSTGEGLFMNIVLLFVAALLFVAGLAMGPTINRQIDGFSGRSLGGESSSGGFASFLSGGGGAPSMRSGQNGRQTNERVSTNSKFNIENEIYEDPDAIRLEDFSGGDRNSSIISEQEPGSSSKESNQGDIAAEEIVAYAESRPTEEQRRAGYVDVPNLI